MGLSETLHVDLVELVSLELGPPQGRKGCDNRRPWWCCPFHADTNPSLTTTENGKGWICFGCGEQGDSISFVQKIHPEWSFKKASFFVACYQKGSPKMSTWSRRSTLPAKSDGPKLATFKSGPDAEWRQNAESALEQLKPATSYNRSNTFLKDRGLTTSTCEVFDIKFNTKTQFISDHSIPKGIVIPWRDEDGVRACRCAN